MNADLLNWIPRLVRALVDARYYRSVTINWIVIDKHCTKDQYLLVQKLVYYNACQINVVQTIN